MTRVAGGHHVLGVEDLLGQLGNGEGAVLLASSTGQRRESWDEEMQTWEWNHVDSELAEIRIQLTRKPEAGGDTAHGCGHQVVEVSISRGGQLQGSEADVVQGFVVDTECLVGILDKLVDGERSVVRFDNRIGQPSAKERR